MMLKFPSSGSDIVIKEENMNLSSEYEHESNKSLKKHLEEVGETMYECEHCGKNVDLITLKTHLGIKTQLPFPCQHCDLHFDKGRHLDEHLMFEHPEKMNRSKEIPHECQHCGKMFKTKRKLSRHSKMHQIKKPFKCEQCGKKYKYERSLTTHLEVHANELGYDECRYSRKKFKNGDYLLSHSRTQKEDLPFECNYCGKKFERQRRTDLNTHLRTHTKVKLVNLKPFECEECGKKFMHNDDLKEHMIVHTKESPSPHEFQSCGETFLKQKQHLKAHLPMHTCETENNSGEKYPKVQMEKQQYGCGKCGERFMSIADVKKHVKTHEKLPFKCNQCGKKFKQRYSVKRHMQIHTGEMPYECEYCGKKFRQKSNLNRHAEIHTGKRHCVVVFMVNKRV